MIDRISVMHDNRFLHRDIKPDNFVIESGSNAKMLYLIDFGLSKHYIVIYNIIGYRIVKDNILLTLKRQDL